jgi:hypothetical protein
MPTVPVNINITSIGTDAGPFTIADNVIGTLATGVTRTSLLGNFVVNADSTATQITVTSSGVCTSTITIPIDFHPCPSPTPPPPPPTPPPPPPGTCAQNVVINVTDYGYIKYYNCTSETTEYQYMSSLGNQTLTNCLDYTTLAPGIPYADVAVFTIVNNGVPCSTPPPPPPPPSGSAWIIRNASCGFGTINDVGINGNFMGTLEGPSTFPLSSTLYGDKTNPNGINYNTSNNTLQVNVTTNLPGSGNCGFLFVYLNGQVAPTYQVQFTSTPVVSISGLYFASGDQVEVVVSCYPDCG